MLKKSWTENRMRLFRRYWPRFFRVALGVVPQPADAEDVAQDALIRLLGRLGGFDPARGAFSSWAYRLVVNVALDRLRDRRRRRDEAPLDRARPDGAAEGPSAAAERREMVALVMSSIDELPEQQRAAR